MSIITLRKEISKWCVAKRYGPSLRPTV